MIVQTPIEDNPAIEFRLITSLFGKLKHFEIDTIYSGRSEKPFKEVFQADRRNASTTTPANDDDIVTRLGLDPKDVAYARSLTYQSVDVAGLFSAYDELYLSDSLISNEDSGVMIRVIDSHYGPIGSGPHLITEFYDCQK